jgi:hypothetical protein
MRARPHRAWDIMRIVMPTPDIPLTGTETKLFEAISFEGTHGDYQAALANGKAARALVESLIARNGIPEVRWKYFTQKNYRQGRLKGSWRDLFYRNGNSDEEMYEHFSFLQHLRYFVCGPDLSPEAIDAFREEVARCGGVSSSDITHLGTFARQEARTRQLLPHEACEEYFKLALDLGIWVSYAHMIRHAVAALR